MAMVLLWFKKFTHYIDNMHKSSDTWNTVTRFGLVIAFNITSSIQLRKLKNKVRLNQGLKHGCTC